jgi:hypothetical protein
LPPSFRDLYLLPIGTKVALWEGVTSVIEHSSDGVVLVKSTLDDPSKPPNPRPFLCGPYLVVRSGGSSSLGHFNGTPDPSHLSQYLSAPADSRDFFIKALRNRRRLIFNGQLYVPNSLRSDSLPGGFGDGFGGTLFKISFLDERSPLRHNNIWHLGTIPSEWEIPDTCTLSETSDLSIPVLLDCLQLEPDMSTLPEKEVILMAKKPKGGKKGC